MSNTFNLILVVAAVAVSVLYLAWRKIRLARKSERDWSSGHVEACDSCPIIEIRKARDRIQMSSK